MEITFDEMREHLEAIGYSLGAHVTFEVVDELAEIEGYEWNYRGKFVAYEGLDETEL